MYPSLVDPLTLLLDNTIPNDHADTSQEVWLPETLRDLYGGYPRLGHGEIIANFVASLDGSVTLDASSGTGASAISQAAPGDRFTMAILRSISDCMLIGATTFMDYTTNFLEAGSPFPSLGDEFLKVREHLGLPPTHRLAVATASGRLELDHPLITGAKEPLLVLTSAAGAARLNPCKELEVVAVSEGPPTAQQLVAAMEARWHPRIILTEGGPSLFSQMVREGQITSLFLTIAPVLAGRGSEQRYLVDGELSTPGNVTRGKLETLRQWQDLLLAQYRLLPGKAWSAT